jgi:ABC-type multidrug transport system fused ATPase/permease subunit
MTSERIGTLQAALRLLTPRQKWAGLAVGALFALASGLELLSLTTLAVFVSVLVSPDLVEKSRVIGRIVGLLGNPPASELAILLGAVASVLLIAATGAKFGVQFLMDWFGVRIARRLGNRCLAEALHAPYAWHLRQNAGAFSKILFGDASAIGVALFPPLMELFYNGLIVTFSVAIIVAASPWQSLVAILAVGGVALLLSTAVRPGMRHHSAAEREGSVECSKIGVEAIAGAKDILVKTRQGHFLRLYDRALLDSLFGRMKAAALQRVVPMSFLLIGQIGLVVIALALFASNLSGGEIAQQMALLALVVSRFLPALSRALGTVNKINITAPYVDSYVRLMGEIEEAKKCYGAERHGVPVPDDWRELRMTDVAFAYPGSDAAAVRGVSLAIRRGRSYGVVGRSGSGKTTVIDLMLGLHQPQSGRIELDGRPLSDFSPKSWYRRIGYVPQSPFVSDDTLRRNVAFGVPDAEIDDAKVRRALEAAGLGDVLDGLEDGLGTRLGDHGLRLSGGQRQRVAIARALYDDPDILILDEATSALDSLTEHEIQESVKRLAREKTVITIAHRFGTVRGTDTLFVFDEGRLVEQGSFDALYRASPLFRGLAGASEAGAGGQGNDLRGAAAEGQGR